MPAARHGRAHPPPPTGPAPDAHPPPHTERTFIACPVPPPEPGNGAPPPGPGNGAPPPEPGGAPPGFREVEEELAAAKGRLDPHQQNPDLRAALQAVDYHGGLKAVVARRFGGQAVTNAWLKMYELATQMGLVAAGRVPLAAPQGGRTHRLRVFCNAEFPGAFICGLHQLLHTRHPETRYEWVASSLHPGDGRGPLGDYYGLYRHNRAQWLMDPAMRGGRHRRVRHPGARRAREGPPR